MVRRMTTDTADTTTNTNTRPTDWMSDTEVADAVGVTPSAIRQWRRKGRGPAYFRFDGRHIKYSRDDVLAWMEAHPRPALVERVSTTEQA